MSTSVLSGVAVAAGLAALAALLFALQRLRVRHRDVTVVTTLFWREAIEEARARVLLQRFRHPWAYALIVLIASLAWLGVAGLRLDDADARAHVLLVDASAQMAWGTRFADALHAARERAGELPRESTCIVLAGSRIDTLLACGEDLPLLDARSARIAPEATPASIERALLELAQCAPGRNRTAVEVFGDAPVSTELLALLPDEFSVSRAELGTPERRDNAGIVALGVSEAASGAWDAVDLIVDVVGDRAPNLTLTLDGAQLVPNSSSIELDGSTRTYVRDLPARAGRIDARLGEGDAFALDDSASLVLPNRPLIRVALSPGVPALVRTALGADPGVALVDGECDVVVRTSDETFGGAARALELVLDEQAPAFVVRRAEVDDSEAALRECFDLLGLGDIDSTELATQSGRAIELSLEQGPQRAVALRAGLLDARFDFVQSRAFPLFLGRSVRWLAEVEEFEADCAAGARLATQSLSTLDAVGDTLRIPRAGDWKLANGAAVHASWLPDPTNAVDALLPTPATREASGDLVPWMIVLALALLALEWWLVRSERIP